jgi:hypothetical protein
MSRQSRVFNLRPYANSQVPFKAVVITLQPEEAEKVFAAWAYAVRYTAKGLDLPDHSAAVALLKQRHPNWEGIETDIVTVNVDLKQADNDEPEA